MRDFSENALRFLSVVVVLAIVVGGVNAMSFAQDKDAKEAKSEKKDGEEDKEEPTAAEKVSGKFVVDNGEGMKIDFSKAEIVLEERIVQSPPEQLPKDWAEMKQDDRQAWAQKFMASPEGEAYQKKQKEAFENRNILEVIVDDKGEFSLKDVPFSGYFLTGTIYASKGNKKELKKYSADVNAAISIAEGVDHVDLQELHVQLAPLIVVGDPAPEIEFDSLAGDKKFTLKSLRGKYVLVDFWATWCVPCLQATPNVKKAYETYEKSGKFEVIGVNYDDDKDKAIEYVKEKKLPWLQAVTAPDGSASVNFAVRGTLPSFWLIDPQGKIAAMPDDFYFDDSGLDIERVLKEKMK